MMPPLFDSRIERMLVAAVIADPTRLDTLGLAAADLQDFHARAALGAVVNVYARNHTPTVVAVRAELLAAGMEAAASGLRADPDRGWFDELVAIPLLPDPFDRQIVYAIELLAGVRPGEAAALRFRHWDPSVRPLGKLVVARSYNTLRHFEKTTKTEAVKYVPVHPTLGAMLAEWKLGGWAEMMGRAPTPDDLIVPLPPDVSGRRVSRSGEPYRGNAYSGAKWREKDLPTLGWRPRRHYDMRATFITLAIEDGADPEVIRTRITHTPKARNAFEGYNRGLHWERTCQEISKLRVTRGAQRESMAATAGAGNVGSDPLRPAIAAARIENYADNSDRARRAHPKARGAPRGLARSAQDAGLTGGESRETAVAAAREGAAEQRTPRGSAEAKRVRGGTPSAAAARSPRRAPATHGALEDAWLGGPAVPGIPPNNRPPSRAAAK